MNNPLAKLYSWQVSSGQLDGWTSYPLLVERVYNLLIGS